ncbi:MAG: hypothetical protein JXA79_01735 [Deltaproteobacteria bacterium]|nr:hypothetical protein [Deltaproteobacteria bacterium]
MSRSFALFLILVLSISSIVSAETKGDGGWSIDFGAISVSEAFDQLTEVTGIKISTKTHFPHKISPKRYINQDIEKILKDILKNVNHALVWHYNEKGIESITILAFDRNRAKGSATLSTIEREEERTHPERAAQSKTPDIPASDLDLNNEVIESSAELEKTDEIETSGGREELAGSPEETSDIPHKIPLHEEVEPDGDSPEIKEGLPADQEKAGEKPADSVLSEE